GFERAEVLGKSAAELFVPPALREQYRSIFFRFLDAGRPASLGKRIELSAVRADCTEFPIELSLQATSGEGHPKFTAYIRDLTERRRAEAELRRGEEQVRMLLRHINDIVYAWELDSETEQTHTQIVSDQVKSILGYEPWQFFPHPDLWFR